MPQPFDSGLTGRFTVPISPVASPLRQALPGARRFLRTSWPSIQRGGWNGADGGTATPWVPSQRKYASHRHALMSDATPSLAHSSASRRPSAVYSVICVSSENGLPASSAEKSCRPAGPNRARIAEMWSNSTA